MPAHPTLGDVDSAEALAEYQAGKRAHKAELRAQRALQPSGLNSPSARTSSATTEFAPSRSDDGGTSAA